MLMQIAPSHAWAFWVPPIVFESVLLVLAIVKAAQVAHQEAPTSKILGVLIRDSVVYFGGTLSIILVNLVIYTVARVSS